MKPSPIDEQKETSEESGELIQLIVFQVADEEFGANIEQTREIVQTENITTIPDSPDFISGITNIRGEIAINK